MIAARPCCDEPNPHRPEDARTPVACGRSTRQRRPPSRSNTGDRDRNKLENAVHLATGRPLFDRRDRATTSLEPITRLQARNSREFSARETLGATAPAVRTNRPSPRACSAACRAFRPKVRETYTELGVVFSRSASTRAGTEPPAARSAESTARCSGASPSRHDRRSAAKRGSSVPSSSMPREAAPSAGLRGHHLTPWDRATRQNQVCKGPLMVTGSIPLASATRGGCPHPGCGLAIAAIRIIPES